VDFGSGCLVESIGRKPSMRPIEQILAELKREQDKLNVMPLGSDLTLQQSMVVDELINEYYRVSGYVSERKDAV